ncbi:hypothetical protein BD769DRAFT_1661961 [Suillus cothurnatus]|nr:hypothetical protein BD769DRAFT_1661961 [Suillus cothurnatus]
MHQRATVFNKTSQPTTLSLAVTTSESVRQRQKIAQLEEKLQLLESGQATKQREINYYMSKGRAIRRIVTLYDTIKDLINENNRRCDDDRDNEVTPEHDRLQIEYIAINNTLPWFHQKIADMEHDDSMHILKKLRQGADNPPIDHKDKCLQGFVNDACGWMLCPTKLDWNDPMARAGIRDHLEGYIMTEMSWPAFLYQGYTANTNNLEEGPFKSRLLVQAFKAIFTSPSSTKEVSSDGDSANIIENNRCTKKDTSGKKHVNNLVALGGW